MDNLTHSLVGVLIAKTPLGRSSSYATVGAIVAANAPDLDSIAAIGGQASYLEHHRGLSHSIVGILVFSFAVPLVIWLGDLIVSRFRRRPPRVRLRGLIAICLIAGATHPLLDWTNNYGVRPFLPWSNQWYYGDLVFIMDPWLWLLLGGAAFLLSTTTKLRRVLWISLAAVLSFALILAKIYAFPSPASRVGYVTLLVWFTALAGIVVIYRTQLTHQWKTQVAILALALVPLYWGALAIVHRRALNEAQSSARNLSRSRSEQLLRVAAMPTFANPTRWQVLAETDRSVFRYAHALGTVQPAAPVTTFAKPDPSDLPLVNLAARDPQVQALLGFARFPLARVDGQCPKDLVVRFADMRYTEPGTRRGAFAVDIPIDCSETPVISR